MKDSILAGFTGAGAVTTIMANTLPWLQYTAALFAVITGAIFFYDRFFARNDSDDAP